MSHQISQGDRFAIPRRNFEIEILVDVGIKVEFSSLDELHDRSPGEELGNRARPKQGELRIDWFLCSNVGIAKAAFGQRLTVFDDDDHGPRNTPGFHRIRHEPIEPRIDVGLGQIMSRCPDCRGCRHRSGRKDRAIRLLRLKLRRGLSAGRDCEGRKRRGSPFHDVHAQSLNSDNQAIIRTILGGRPPQQDCHSRHRRTRHW